MVSPDDSPRIAGNDVDAEAIEVPGLPLSALAEDLGAEQIVEFVDGMPADGWRVLRRYSPESAFLGAPVPSPEGNLWQTAYFNHAYLDQTQEEETPQPRPVVMLRPGLESQEASRANRRRGLKLRWPANAAKTGPPFCIEIVDSGDEPVHLSGKELHVVGVGTPPGAASFSFG